MQSKDTKTQKSVGDLRKQPGAKFKCVSRQGNLFSACVYTEGASLSLLEVISDIISGKGLSLITSDPHHCCQL